MTPEQLHEIKESLKIVIQEKVNGRIDRMALKLDEHIKRVEPVIKLYEENQILEKNIEKAGRRTVFWGKVVGSVGVLGLGFNYAINHIKL